MPLVIESIGRKLTLAAENRRRDRQARAIRNPSGKDETEREAESGETGRPRQDPENRMAAATAVSTVPYRNVIDAE